jgi:hypothetical protein
MAEVEVAPQLVEAAAEGENEESHHLAMSLFDLTPISSPRRSLGTMSIWLFSVNIYDSRLLSVITSAYLASRIKSLHETIRDCHFFTLCSILPWSYLGFPGLSFRIL